MIRALVFVTALALVWAEAVPTYTTVDASAIGKPVTNVPTPVWLPRALCQLQTEHSLICSRVRDDVTITSTLMAERRLATTAFR